MSKDTGFTLLEELSFSYGYGRYEQGKICFQGGIVLSRYRLFLRGKNGDIPQTYVPLERIYKIRRFLTGGLAVYVRPSQMTEYVVKIFGERPLERDLVKDLIRRRGLKRKFLRFEWVDLNF